MRSLIVILSLIFLLSSCAEDTNVISDNNDVPNDPNTNGANILFETFGDQLDLNNLPNYANQDIPNYIDDDNTRGNEIDDVTASLGRVLFYDKKLSSSNTISCASCHQQENAFGDLAPLSEGVNGITGRHSMRLVNARFGNERRFFWDERANTLEQQTTMPIQDHVEMGFSGQNGDLNIEDLIDKLESELYYQELFSAAFGDTRITETRMQDALAQFIRSIQSFDSKYDEGRLQSNNNNQPFSNFTTQENQGKALFNQGPQFQGNSGIRIGGGLGCNDCHSAPEFDITPNSRNNGVIGIAGTPGATDLTITRSPTLRDLFKNNGQSNGPMMHTGALDINQVIDHYNHIQVNDNLDPRLGRGGGLQLNITQNEREALIAFLKTLSGNDVYVNQKWSDPFLN